MTNTANNIWPAFREWGYHSCGHCQIHLPCSNGIPAKILRKRRAAQERQKAGRSFSAENSGPARRQRK
jgi:hypothetical protein